MEAEIKREMIALLPRLRRFAYGLTGAADRADDLVQATAERAIRHLDQWQRGTRLDSWMFRIAHNLHKNGLRDTASRANHLRLVHAADADATLDGVRTAESRAMVSSVERLMRRIPDEQRAALMLVCVEDISYKDAAGMLDIPIGTVMSRVARGRESLRALMDQDEAASEPARRCAP